MKILVTGSTGKVGSALLKELVNRKASVRALVRKADASLPPGVEPVVGDLLDPVSFEKALVGVDKLFLLNGVVADELTQGLIAFGLAKNGIDFDLSAVVVRGWIVQAAYAYTDGEVTRDTNPTRVGLRIFNTPRHTANLWTTYTFSGGPLEGFGVGAGWQYIDRRASNAANTFFIPSYTLATAALFYTRGPWRAALNVKNLADKNYFDSGGSFVPLYPGAPREFQFNLSYTF